jgi:hypothetical protein
MHAILVRSQSATSPQNGQSRHSPANDDKRQKPYSEALIVDDRT